MNGGLKGHGGRPGVPRFSRRVFSGLLAASAAGLAAGAAGLWALLHPWLRRLGPPALDDAPAGSIGARILDTLLAVTRAVVNEPITEEHYAGFFRWRAEHLRGHGALYERFCSLLDRAATREAGRNFAACPIPVQRQVLEPAFRVRAAAAADPSRPIRGAAREWLLYDRHIVQEILAVFARTDVWVLLGYDAWPGTPRGLERYREAPRRKA